VEGISDLITIPGIINIDFADIKSILENAGSALMGIGTASGEKRAEEAARMAINSPLLDLSIQGAKGVLFSIAGGEDLTMFEIQDAAKVITESIDSDAKVIFGTVRDDRLKKNEIKITVIASGFPETVRHRPLFPEAPLAERNGGNIFNTLMGSNKKEEPKIEEEKKRAEEKEKKEDKSLPLGDEDNWGAVPAFLRRKK
jgi:cell division protein FtsZ